MDNLIRVYDNVIDNEYCKKLIDRFETNKQLHQSFDDRGMIFTQINIQKEGWYNDVNILSKVFQDNIDNYKKDCKIEKQQMPMNYILEPIRMKRYLPNNHDEFQTHVDVNQRMNCTRFLVMFLYLANNKKGKTIFPNLDVEIECKQGSLLMFPPMWPWLHAGQKPARISKYIMQSYLHYVN
jgi:hypothetical protein|tara:strand:- start:1795 stop:2337 length:543 start_codon:yes stop_codon:yes gene_type:complete